MKLKLAAIPPQKRKSKPITRWTLKRFVQWLQKQWKIDFCRETVRRSLKKLGFSWKKAKKRCDPARVPRARERAPRQLLNKSNATKRNDFVEKITGLLNDAIIKSDY